MANARGPARTVPSFLTNPALAELLAAELDELGAAPGPVPSGDGDGQLHRPAPEGPRDRARRSFLNGAAAEIRTYIAPADPDGSS